MAHSELQSMFNAPNDSSSWPVEPHPPWMQALLRDPRFLAHIVIPEAMNAPPDLQPYWQKMGSTVRKYPTVRARRDNTGSTARYRHYQYTNSCKHRAIRSRQPIPSAYYPSQQTTRYSKAPYQAAARVRLARRPVTWRRGYYPPSRSGIKLYLSKLGYLIRKPTARTPYGLNLLISCNSRRRSPLSFDIRKRPQPEYGQNIYLHGRPPNPINLYQLATSPPVSRLIIWHRKLPWYIEVNATHPNGVTIQDVLLQVYHNLRRPISKRDFYTTALSEKDREIIGVVFQERCYGDVREIEKGVRRVDFLGREIGFRGLVRSRKGTWELRTGLIERPRMIIASLSAHLLNKC